MTLLLNNNNKYNGLQIDNKNFMPYEYNNCYTYAINQPVNPYTKEKYRDYLHCQPGYLGGKRKEGRNENVYDNFHILIDLAKKDLNDIGYEMIESTYEEYVDDIDCWKVAFAYSSTDYHWYRQNINGTWSHKVGQRQVENFDNSGNIIYDPRACDRGRYEHFLGFYMIRRIAEELLMSA